MHIKISHESPISLLQLSKTYNDFDYCLVHLMETHQEYRHYFLNARNIYNREVLLDNSIFELGKAFDPEKYINWVEQIKPNMLVVPDVLENAPLTIDSWVCFMAEYRARLNKLDSRRIGVVQGKTIHEIKDCYEFMSCNADIIAISFNMSFFETYGKGNTKLERQCTGRPALISHLIKNNWWDWDKPHHLLGCSLPQEFSYYIRHNIHNIRSIDTSNPIVHGLHNIRYNGTLGLKDKVKQKLAELIEAIPTRDQMEIVDYNISFFNKIVQGEI